ncbi:antA/AntB antirepressor family protein [Bartonella raoultii]|uniref:AntA/AntB antirepressor family protein n=1 Tax=Bartonella raoultii TaxID=1457020 RepID=A0ABS7I7J6_9HYPH|nr:antA/AntB antirepressor family protein [Bartonella raoultii]MBX4336452.1 antA/AntB antirepressor family protein [Bartonella raoultii]
MEKLIAIQSTTIRQQTVQTVSARDLHTFLEVKIEFRKWIANCIKEFGLREDTDFVTSTKKLPSRGGPSKDYALTLDTAKHIAICEPGLKGKQVREYFLKCEKKANSKIDYSNPETLENFLRHLEAQIKHNENVVTKNGVKHA